MTDKKVISFDDAKEPHVHRRRDKSAADFRDAFREARLGSEAEKKKQKKKRRKKKKK
ncbi:MAG TPA: hypothetical protein QF611_13130 [Pseudomonadales bacterium]|jgi:hypothetical protein|nr:hypothetical protein [Pseudomonadales bacterium]MDP7316390.1 hypothetical protein [Pseudomonadales bacterium]HJP51968.1 hypothetical protein [Pseudomonadales bacterium]|tara:strand:+ start:900 stop:1070 length:171 start_codon:yes stop_codon:yes gene_type:complete